MKSLMRWDPFRMMRKWDPFDEIRSMQQEMDNLVARFMGTVRHSGDTAVRMWDPAVESYVKDGKLILKAELPGIEPRDLEVTVTDRELLLKGERRSEKSGKDEGYGYREIAYGAFERRIELPEGARVNDLKATFTNGILEIAVPVPRIPEARKVKIETQEGKQIEAGPAVKKAA